MGQWLADSAWELRAVLAGLAVGTIVVFLIPASEGWVALVAVLVGSALLSALVRRKVALLGVGLAFLLWMEATASRFAIAGPMPAGSSFGFGDSVAVVSVAFGCLLAAAAYPVGLAFRRWSTRLPAWRPLGWLAVVWGLVSALAICVSMIAIAPADASFRFTLPAGWSSVTVVQSRYLLASPPYCGSYAAGTGVGLLAGAGPESLTVPTLCATVVNFPPYLLNPYENYSGSKACYYVLANGGGGEGALSEWTLKTTPSSPPIGGSYEEVRAGPHGDVIYGFGLERWRSVGPFSEHLCYVVALTVPHGASMSEADANATLSTFSFR
ncbi:MAG: hypothetical protein ACHQ01_02630 [Candidatus Limnocylindrales bacterium]